MIEKVTAGSNAALLLGAMIGFIAFLVHFLNQSRKPPHLRTPSARWMFGLVALSMFLTMLLRAYWLPLFADRASGIPRGEGWFEFLSGGGEHPHDYAGHNTGWPRQICGQASVRSVLVGLRSGTTRRRLQCRRLRSRAFPRLRRGAIPIQRKGKQMANEANTLATLDLLVKNRTEAIAAALRAERAVATSEQALAEALAKFEIAALTSLQEGDVHPVALSGDYGDLQNLPTIPQTPADIGAATAEEGALARTAMQSTALATVASTNNYHDLNNLPTIPQDAGGHRGGYRGPRAPRHHRVAVRRLRACGAVRQL